VLLGAVIAFSFQFLWCAVTLCLAFSLSPASMPLGPFYHSLHTPGICMLVLRSSADRFAVDGQKTTTFCFFWFVATLLFMFCFILHICMPALLISQLFPGLICGRLGKNGCFLLFIVYCYVLPYVPFYLSFACCSFVHQPIISVLHLRQMNSICRFSLFTFPFF